MKLNKNLLIVIFALFLVSCSSKNWYYQQDRSIASAEGISNMNADMLASWGSFKIEIGQADEQDRIPVYLQLKNISDEDIVYTREMITILSDSNSQIEIEKSDIDDEVNNWSLLSNKYIPKKPLDSKVIKGKALVKRDHLLKDVIYIDAKKIVSIDKLNVLVSSELLKIDNDIYLPFVKK